MHALRNVILCYTSVKIWTRDFENILQLLTGCSSKLHQELILFSHFLRSLLIFCAVCCSTSCSLKPPMGQRSCFRRLLLWKTFRLFFHLVVDRGDYSLQDTEVFEGLNRCPMRVCTCLKESGSAVHPLPSPNHVASSTLDTVRPLALWR